MESHIVSEILKKNEALLARHLVLSRTVLDKLHTKGLVPDYTRRKILMHPAEQQVGLLLKTLEGRGLSSLRKFLEVLKETGHGYLVDTILDTEAIPVTDLRRPDTTMPATGKGGYSRPVHTVHDSRPSVGGPSGHVASLNSLLRMRQDQEQTTARGALLPRTLLTDPIATGGYPGVGIGGGGVTYHHGYPPPAPAPVVAYDNSRENLPGTLYNLSQMFTHQQKEHERAMVTLRQEEMAIKQLMEQNARDQQKIRRKQFTMDDMSKRLADINARASEIYEPAPHPHISRYRLAQLNQIPWSVDQ